MAPTVAALTAGWRSTPADTLAEIPQELSAGAGPTLAVRAGLQAPPQDR